MTGSCVIDLPLHPTGDCASCADRLREGLRGHRGVVGVTERPGRGRVEVLYDDALCDEACLDRTVQALVADLVGHYGHSRLQVDGMDCADCAHTIQRAVSRLDGVTAASIAYPAGLLQVEFEPAATGPEQIAAQVVRLGYAVPGVAAAGAGGARGRVTALLAGDLPTAVAAAWLAVALVLDLATGLPAWPAYLAATVAGGLPLARTGLVALLATRRTGIELLMAIAATGALAIGAWLEAALVVVLFGVGAVLERRSASRARRELTELVSLAPEMARVRRRTGSGPLALIQELEVRVVELAVGDRVVVRPGERIPSDGTVVSGSSAVDQAAITGESAPVDKQPGDAVFAGTLNAQGALVVEVGSAPGDTTLDRVRRFVADAQARKSPSERWVDAFARWYTPAVVGAAVAVAALPPLFGVAFSRSFYDALALLILACPCALVVSTPVAIVSALARASAAGVLVKGGEFLERAAAVTAVAFDKTGTLTEGRPRVVAVEPLAPGLGEDALLALAASLEAASEHPLARAIVAAAHERGLALEPVEEFAAVTGLGAGGLVAGRRVEVAAAGAGAGAGAAAGAGAGARVEALREQGLTVVEVTAGGAPAGLVAVADGLRPAAPEALAGLVRLGLRDLVMLTGDDGRTAAAVASGLPLAGVRAGLLPQDKGAAVAALGAVAMVGDGVNDAPALAAAHLGIAMGSAGSDTAVEVADVAILGDDLRTVPGLIGLARWTRAVVRQNIAFALGTKLLVAGILAAGMLPLWGAVVSDVGASLIVVANALRLLRGRPLGPARALPLLAPALRSARRG